MEKMRVSSLALSYVVYIMVFWKDHQGLINLEEAIYLLLD